MEHSLYVRVTLRDTVTHHIRQHWLAVGRIDLDKAVVPYGQFHLGEPNVTESVTLSMTDLAHARLLRRRNADDTRARARKAERE